MTPEAVVRAELAAWDHLDRLMRLSYFAPDAVWDNIPVGALSGHDEIRKAAEQWLRPLTSFAAEILNLAVAGNVVLLERVDHSNWQGQPFATRTMGAFEVDGDRSRRGATTSICRRVSRCPRMEAHSRRPAFVPGLGARGAFRRRPHLGRARLSDAANRDLDGPVRRGLRTRTRCDATALTSGAQLVDRIRNRAHRTADPRCLIGHYACVVGFDLRVVDESSGHGYIQLGEFQEAIRVDVESAPLDWYLGQWQYSLGRLVADHTQATVVISIPERKATFASTEEVDIQATER